MKINTEQTTTGETNSRREFLREVSLMGITVAMIGGVSLHLRDSLRPRTDFKESLAELGKLLNSPIRNLRMACGKLDAFTTEHGGKIAGNPAQHPQLETGINKLMAAVTNARFEKDLPPENSEFKLLSVAILRSKRISFNASEMRIPLTRENQAALEELNK